MGAVEARLSEMDRRQRCAFLHPGDFARDDALGRQSPANLGSDRARLRPRAMVEEDFRAEMRRIEAPTLIIHGDRDRSAPIELTGKPSAQLIPGCGLLVYEGAPHGLIFTHMDRLQADILRFMRET